MSGPLPVTLGSVKAKRVNDAIVVSWENLTEENISFYRVERSIEGIIFSPMTQVLPSFNNGTKAVYGWTDMSPAADNNYYRIVAVETDGKSIYSGVVRITTRTPGAAMSIYPNPVGHSSYLLLSDLARGNYEISVFDLAGHQIWAKTVSHDGGSVSLPLHLPYSMTAGIYILYLNGDNYRLHKNFVYQ